MTNATTTVIARVAAVVAGLGLVAASFAPMAMAQTTTTTTTTTTSATFTRDLTLGSTGADVTALQNWLISKGHSIAAGATGYFGAQTRAALAAWQAANGVMPAAGYFGPMTRAKIAGMGGSTTGGSTTPGTSGLSGGEASIEDFDIQDADMDEVEEGSSAEVAEVTFDIEDGDIRIDRLDIELDQTGGGTVSESDPWDAFETITLFADGKEIASENVSDEDDWLDDNAQIFRFTGLDYVIEEGESGTITVEVEAQNGVLNTGDTDTWTLEVNTDGLRGVDARGIQQYAPSSAQNLTFDLVEEGQDDELSVRSSTEDPDAATLTVEDDRRSDWYTIFAFDLEADEDGGDIELDNLPVRFSTNDSDITTVLNDAKLMIDGEEFDDITGSIGATTTFDIDGDYTVESGDRVTVEVMVQFKALTGNYSEGTTVSASTTGAFITAEGSDDVTPTGAASGETHNLRTSGLDVAFDEKSAVAQVVDGSDNDFATYKVTVDVTAFEDEFFISQTGATAFTYQIEDASTGAVLGTSTATTSVVSSSADLEGSAYRVGEGDTESFTFTVTLNPLAADEGKSFRMQLLSIVFGTSSGSPTGQTWNALPASTYETQGVLIND